ncbi:hypothetical protein [Emticicia sp. BO119]|uniref:hypothetical protein n=1 Tax=Emticicia sp. BO119 TaxID=2757768 RepID=UPI0015F0462F|nr:hypothetical protein [Emticicia sp. BO119]MBA4852822.1 hypothetical protein [Emticicia sp. BO119]
MKATFSILSIFFVLLACQNKQDKIQPIPVTIPDATFRVNIDNSNTATFTFNLNSNEIYTIDFGEGSTHTDKLPEDYTKITNYYVRHHYSRNGNFKVILTIKNASYISEEQKNIEASNIAIADFSYEVLANGQVKLKNLSENKNGYYQWFIGTNALSNGNYFIHTTGREEPVLNFDLNGKYKIKLQAISGNTSEITKTIDIRNATKQMTFSGYYKDQKINIALDGSEFYYTSYVRDGIINQTIYTEDSTGVKSIILWKDYYFPFDTYLTKEKKYTLIRDFIKNNDSDVVELEEETLDPDLYNNIGEIYSKALWIRYKVKNEQLDGEMKIRLLIR